jgi:NAD(P)-dependent dehydrogenase (short-subunit alcohol dehydrogenase family)
MEALIQKIKPATATKSWNLDLIPKTPNKVFLITGGTQGYFINLDYTNDSVGLGISLALLKHAQPAKLYILSDKKEHFTEAMDLFRQEAPSAAGAVEWKQVDFLNVKEVDKVGKSLANLPRLDCVWCNAGIGTAPQLHSVEGLDGHFTLNHLSHYVLMQHLLRVVRKTAKEQGEARVVFTSSSLHMTAQSDIKFESKEEINKNLGPNNLYARSKLATLLYARQLAKKVTNEAVYINAIHPGAVKTGYYFKLQSDG